MTKTGFDVLDLKMAVGTALNAKMEDEQKGNTNPLAVKAALSEFSRIWSSPECFNYRSGFGKLALMAHARRGKAANEENPIFDSFTKTLQYGNDLNRVYSTGQFNQPNLLENLGELYKGIQLMEVHAEDIDDAFRKAAVLQKPEKLKH